jgi:hypothetical protein
MSKGQILAKYKHLSPEEQRSFDRWLRANAVVGSMFALALMAFALVGLRTEERTTASAPKPAQTISVQELHGMGRPESLPVDHIHNQALVFIETEAEGTAMADRPTIADSARPNSGRASGDVGNTRGTYRLPLGPTVQFVV